MSSLAPQWSAPLTQPDASATMTPMGNPAGADEFDRSLMAMTTEKAASLTGLSVWQLRYWRATGLIGSSINRTLSLRNHVHLYTFPDLVSLLVAVHLRDADFHVRHIRRLVNHLRDVGFEQPLSELKFAFAGREIYFQRPDGTWSGDKQPEQFVLHQAIQLKPIYARIQAGTGRSAKAAGKVEKRRGAHGSKPVFAETRIPVDTVVRRLQNGFDDQSVLDAYPDLTPADIEVARRLAVSA